MRALWQIQAKASVAALCARHVALASAERCGSAGARRRWGVGTMSQEDKARDLVAQLAHAQRLVREIPLCEARSQKLRVQVHRGADGPSFLRALVDASKAGPRGLFRGAGARVLFSAPSMGASMACFEQAKSLLLSSSS